jgi:hypothetical protein
MRNSSTIVNRPSGFVKVRQPLVHANRRIVRASSIAEVIDIEEFHFG